MRRGGQDRDEDLENDPIEDSQLLDNDDLMGDYVEQTKGPMKKRVVPNNNQDKWLVYLLNNLNKANDLNWVNELLDKIKESQDEFNSGKFRGAVF